MKHRKGRLPFAALPVLLLTLSLMTHCESNAEATQRKEAYFAGGCFWCIEADFEKLPGVISVVSGYAGGRGENPTYRNYSRRGHIEVARIIYDAEKISYAKLLSYFMTRINPLDGEGQFCDRGPSYATAIFYRTAAEKKLALKAIHDTGKILGKPVRTRVIRFTKFWKAEGYHQNYYIKNPLRYRSYRNQCQRDQKLREVWQGKKLPMK